MTKEQKEHISNFGALGYDESKCLSLLGLDDKPEGFDEAYKKGRLMFQYAIDRVLMEHAMKGDLKALRELEGRSL